MTSVVRSRSPLLLAAVASLLTTQTLGAQQRDEGVRYGISIGDSRRVKGLRINFRDRRMERVDGVNLILWTL